MGKPDENDLPEENDLTEPDAGAFVEDDQTFADEPTTELGDYVEPDGTQDPDVNGGH